jgi:nucleotide-binding universal stress UspA family protein
VIEREGQPAFVICDVADELNADLIVMGCRGVGLIEEVQDESVTARVINLSPCPVLIIP